MNGCSNLDYISPNISKLKDLEVIFFSNSDSLTEESWYDSPSAVGTARDNIHTQSPDASSSCKWKYDVFLSFHGIDVGSLLSQLNSIFLRQGITIFTNHKIKRGFSRQIRKSRIALVVLSENYASSSWCLDELVEILKCREEIGQKVIPIFDGVDLAHIRKQMVDTGKTSKRYTVDKQQEWEQAFTVLNQLQGYHVRDWGCYSQMVLKIADDISFALNNTQIVPRIRNSLDQETEKTLTVHYDGLKRNEKVLFRHISCFLNNETYENVMRLLEESELDVGVGLKSLFDKSLIQISEERVISMHFLLQKIGRDIVLGPFIHQPAKRRFLKDTREGCDILIDQSGTENVFGISFRVSELGETWRRDERFKGMKKLQFMRMYKESLYGKEVRFHLVKGLHSMQHHLNYFDW